MEVIWGEANGAAAAASTAADAREHKAEKEETKTAEAEAAICMEFFEDLDSSESEEPSL